jgi:hypothetical protein
VKGGSQTTLTDQIREPFEHWAIIREVQLRGYRRTQIQNAIFAGDRSRILRTQLESLDRERFDPGKLVATSSLAQRRAFMPGAVYMDRQPAPSVGLSFRLSLPRPFLDACPDIEQVIEEAIAKASERTGLHLQVISDVKGGSNYVMEGYLDPIVPVTAMKDKEESLFETDETVPTIIV